MPKSRWFALSLIAMFGAISAPRAHADTYSVTFTCTAGCSSAAAPTAPDITLPGTPTMITETWGGVTYDLLLATSVTIPASASDYWEWTDVATYCNTAVPDDPASCFVGEEYYSVGLFDTDNGASWIGGNAVGVDFAPADLGSPESGTLSFTDLSLVATPEPATFGLMLTGLATLGLCMLLRKRISLGLQRVS
jgi:hypothetical protein